MKKQKYRRSFIKKFLFGVLLFLFALDNHRKIKYTVI